MCQYGPGLSNNHHFSKYVLPRRKRIKAKIPDTRARRIRWKKTTGIPKNILLTIRFGFFYLILYILLKFFSLIYVYIQSKERESNKKNRIHVL